MKSRYSSLLLLCTLMATDVVAFCNNGNNKNMNNNDSHGVRVLKPKSTAPAVRLQASVVYFPDQDDASTSKDLMGKAATRSKSANKSKRVNTNNASKRVLASDKGNGVSMPLIQAIWYSQGTILVLATVVVAILSMTSGSIFDLSALHWNDGSFHSLFDWNLSNDRVLLGMIAAMPMIAIGQYIENSDSRDAAHVNFSTTNMVISLFGRRRQKNPVQNKNKSIKNVIPSNMTTSTHDVLWLSLLIALSTGISEEIVFRGYIPAGVATLTHSFPLALLFQATIFSIGHLSHKSTMGENKVISVLQLINGLWYGLVYAATGGDILPCIIAHVLYDMHTFSQNWIAINDQMDYTESAFRKSLSDAEEQEIQFIQAQAGPKVLSSTTLNFARRFFYAFDREKVGSLSLSDVQRAASYAFINDKFEPTPEDVERIFYTVLDGRQTDGYPSNRLSLSEFLKVLFALKSKNKQAWA